tara:strand:+ start:884 stop:1147 length:264 start_codon:yes stop_codon:yes gene_type:complete
MIGYYVFLIKFARNNLYYIDYKILKNDFNNFRGNSTKESVQLKIDIETPTINKFLIQTASIFIVWAMVQIIAGGSHVVHSVLLYWPD